jgi:hypothetical protein
VLECILEERTYDLAEAYADDLHIRLLNAETDDDLIAFVRAWGPLYVRLDQQKGGGVACLTLSYHRAFQQWIRAFVNLISAYKRGEEEHKTLQKFMKAEYGLALARNSLPNQEPFALASLKWNFGINGSISDWLEVATLALVRSAIAFMIETLPVPSFPTLICSGNKRGRRVEGTWILPDLETAITWMVWYDEFTQHPIVCCQECRTVFRGETAHVRKYCSNECAHRATGREWQRRKRAALRSSKRKQRSGRK